MIRKITLLFLVFMGVQYASYSQALCGFDQVHSTMMTNNAAYAQNVSKLNTDIANWLSTQPNPNSLIAITSSGDTVYEVPLVVHVMHTGGTVGTIYNPTDTRINNTIDYVNQTFAATWSGYPGPGNGGTEFPFRFKLAQRDPNCAATTGINRINVLNFSDYDATGYDYGQYGVRRSNSTGVRDDSIKRLSIWPNDRYYNIWVVNRIDGNDGTSGSFVAGYAYFPGAPANVDGTVMLATQMRPNRITLPHELGHAFSLYHTFQGMTPPTGCPPNTNCNTQGDRCCDTEPHYLNGPGTCYSGQNNPCTGNTFSDATARNFMNYANCQNRFTPDQRDRFISAIINSRSSLITSSASLPIPTTSLPTVCVPGHNNPTSTQNVGPRNILITDAGTNPKTHMDLTSGGFFNDGQNGYIDNTCFHQVQLQAGNQYTITVGTGFNEKCLVYLDYNNDGIMGNSTGERINMSTSGSTHTGTFTVPLTATSCTPIRMRVIADRTTNNLDSCSNMVLGQTEDYEAFILGNNASGASVTVSNPPIGGNPSCNGAALTFYAVPSSGITLIGYQWYKNSTALGGQTTDTLKDPGNIFNNNDTAWVEIYYSNLCGIDTLASNRVVVKRVATVTPAVTIGVTGGTNPTCIDDTVTLSVVSNVNPGGAPTYQWRVNGVNVPGATGTSFKSIGNGGDAITVQMTSSAPTPCALPPKTAVSNAIVISYTQKLPVANIALTVGTNPGCAGQQLQFTAIPTTGGTNPTYQWTVNGTNVTGATGVNFSTSNLQNGDEVRVRMTSNSQCANPKTVTSDSIEVIHTKITADIVIAQTTGGAAPCQGKPVIFSANTINAGKNPTYQWIVNGIPIQGATNPFYLTDSLRNGDRVQAILIATDSCVLNKFDTSNFITMNITPSNKPTVSFRITDGKNPGCIDSLVEFTATAVNIGTDPNYTWLVNGIPVASDSVFSSSSLPNGTKVQVRANQTDGGCYLPDTVLSTELTMVRSQTPTPPIISLIGNKIYTNFDSSFVWFGPDGQMPDGPKGIAYPNKIGSYYAVTNNNGCWSPPSNILGITLLDISTIDMTGMDVYPNPTSDKVVIDWNGRSVNYDVEVYNSVGQIVLTDEVKNETKKVINLASFASGNYFILMRDAQGQVGVLKVTLEK